MYTISSSLKQQVLLVHILHIKIVNSLGNEKDPRRTISHALAISLSSIHHLDDLLVSLLSIARITPMLDLNPIHTSCEAGIHIVPNIITSMILLFWGVWTRIRWLFWRGNKVLFGKEKPHLKFSLRLFIYFITFIMSSLKEWEVKKEQRSCNLTANSLPLRIHLFSYF